MWLPTYNDKDKGVASPWSCHTNFSEKWACRPKESLTQSIFRLKFLLKFDLNMTTTTTR